MNELFDVNRSEGFIVSQANPLKGAEFRSSENSSLESKVVVNDNLITRKEVLAAHKAWTNALVSISQTYKKDGFQAAKSLAGDVIDGPTATSSEQLLSNPPRPAVIPPSAPPAMGLSRTSSAETKTSTILVLPLATNPTP